MDDAATLTTLSDRYRLDERIGSGGAGEVWLGTDTALARLVAVKLLHPALQQDERTVERFRREAAAAGQLQHANAVLLYDVGRHEGRDYLVMEYVDGPPLSVVLEQGAMQPHDVAALGEQVARGLAAAHDLGLVHRDVKPANILLSGEGRAKVADFGIAKAVGESRVSLTATGTIVGSAAYLAPEQLRGDEIDGRADVYALGLLLHECLTGRRPFGEGTPAEVAARRLHGEPEPPGSQRSDVPEGLDTAIARATRSDPDDRFPDASAMAEALGRLTPPDATERLARLARTHAERTSPSTAVLPRAESADGGGADDTLDLGTPRGGTWSAPGATGHLSADEPDAEDERVQEADGGGSRRVIAIAGTALAVALVAVVAIAGGGGDGEGDTGAPQGSEPVPVATASDFDPFGGGGEHGNEVPLAHDGDPSTAWRTERYARPYMGGAEPDGGLKPGTGIWFDLGAPTDVAVVRVQLGHPGIDLEVYGGQTQPHGDPRAWGSALASIQDAPGELTVDVPEGTSPRYVLLWVTKVAGGRAAIAEVSFTAR